MDDAQHRQIAARQVSLRTANTRTVLGRGARTIVDIMCECGRVDCERMLAVSRSAFEKARAVRRHFLVAPGHGIEELEVPVKQAGHF